MFCLQFCVYILTFFNYFSQLYIHNKKPWPYCDLFHPTILTFSLWIASLYLSILYLYLSNQHLYLTNVFIFKMYKCFLWILCNSFFHNKKCHYNILSLNSFFSSENCMFISCKFSIYILQFTIYILQFKNVFSEFVRKKKWW